MIFKTKTRATQGQEAEHFALEYLNKKNLRLLKQNYSCKHGEIDLIMEDNEAIVFVEVRYRKSDHYGGAAASVNHAKQQRIQSTAKHYLVKHGIYEKKPVRFDVVAIVASDVQWIKGAF